MAVTEIFNRKWANIIDYPPLELCIGNLESEEIAKMSPLGSVVIAETGNVALLPIARGVAGHDPASQIPSKAKPMGSALALEI
ncbi:MAG TPA: hypothetical protein VHT21_06305 [Stellaceae bacterium]|nr:hypothetical protein [Stellaceae bacterium]